MTTGGGPDVGDGAARPWVFPGGTGRNLSGGPAAGPSWRPTSALIRALLFVVVATGLGLGVGRADLVLMVAPMAVLLALGLTATRSDRPGQARSRARLLGPALAGRVAAVDLSATGTGGVQLVTLVAPDAAAAPAAGWVTVPGERPVGRVTLRLPSWGRSTLARPELTLAGPDGLWEYGPIPAPDLLVDVLPVRGGASAVDLPPIYGGWAGEHVSRRPGQGGDLVDLREYQPGDRLRSVHWRAFARHQQLYVRRTRSDADAEFVLCLDTRDQIRPQSYPARTGRERFLREWAARLDRSAAVLRGLFVIPGAAPAAADEPASSLDLTVDAALSIATAQLKVGDRVGVLDLGRRRRRLVMGTGLRHLERVRSQLGKVDLTPVRTLIRAHAWGVPAGAVVVLISPLADSAVVTAAVEWRAAGHQVIVVDVLPAAGLTAMAGPDPVRRAELALLDAERVARSARLHQVGIPVVRWEDGTMAADLLVWRRAGRNRR